ncbi:hypothetical protein [Flavobacterium sp. T12S277]|uniref:hypothetical protein n=1 Tax=Flavobacterium sp. T12S277 TaxID=3402752 RepID=UPI003ADD8605
MKKLELKNLTVKKLAKNDLSKIKGGAETSGWCNKNSIWPVPCSSAAWTCEYSDK